MTKLKKDDNVIVISGNHKGLTGNVMRIDGDKIVVQGINVCKKHMKPTQDNPKGSIAQIERPIHISNVALCVEGIPVKLHTKVDTDGNKVIYYVKEGKEITHRTLRSKKNV